MFLPPDDYADPELTENRLPQPYQMLTEIVDENVVEATWDIIRKTKPDS